MPTQAQAGVYSAIRHKAIAAAGTDEAKAVMAKMRDIPVDDFYARNGRLREDGRLVHDMYFAEVKKPAELRGAWDDYDILGVIPARAHSGLCKRAAARWSNVDRHRRGKRRVPAVFRSKTRQSNFHSARKTDHRVGAAPAR